MQQYSSSKQYKHGKTMVRQRMLWTTEGDLKSLACSQMVTQQGRPAEIHNSAYQIQSTAAGGLYKVQEKKLTDMEATRLQALRIR